MKRLAWAPGALAGMLALVTVLYLAVISFAFATDSYPQDGVYGDMATKLVAYMDGTSDALDDSLFTERERLHMVDVRGLFEGGRTLAIVCAWGALAMAVLTLLAGGRMALGKGIHIGVGFFIGLLVGMIAWAAIDFTGWFTAMHELVFTNDLWLLDPNESMLINMLPEVFFFKAAQSIAVRLALGVLLLELLAFLLQRGRPQRRQNGVSG